MEGAGKGKGRKEEGRSQEFPLPRALPLTQATACFFRDLSVTDKPIPRINDIRPYYQPLCGK